VSPPPSAVSSTTTPSVAASAHAEHWHHQTMSSPRSWHVVIPVKGLATAKTRLCDDPGRRRALALAMALDTALAAADSYLVSKIWVVTPDSDVVAAMSGLGVQAVPEPSAEPKVGGLTSLNRALRAAGATVSSQYSKTAVAVLTADLPALTSEDLTSTLHEAGHSDRAVVGDCSGVGTTMLTAGPTTSLNPLFGQHSLARHMASGATALTASERLRLDVDTESDLTRALRLGLGPMTRQLI